MVLNEIVAHTDAEIGAYDSNDDIEIYNTSDSTILLADWYLSDDKDALNKWRSGEAAAMIGAGAWLTFSANLSRRQWPTASV